MPGIGLQDSETPLFAAVRSGHWEVAELLLRSGADMEHTTKSPCHSWVTCYMILGT